MSPALRAGLAAALLPVSQNFQQLQAEVADDINVESSAVTLLTGIEGKLDAAIAAHNNGDTDALPALKQQIAASKAGLAAAVAAGTAALGTQDPGDGSAPGTTDPGVGTSTSTATATATDTGTST